MKDKTVADLLPYHTYTLSFGPFILNAKERLLTRDGVPLELGARTLDMLIALVSRPNEVVGKRELLAQVWPDVIVEEGSLRFHIASLRRALGDGTDGARYITTLAGRGYCFVAPVSKTGDGHHEHPADAADVPRTNLPNRLMRMIGRDGGVAMLSGQLVDTRFVTIVGTGGIGKTTVAVAVGHGLVDAFQGSVLFVDLGALRDSKLTATSLASLLGLSVQSDDPFPSLIAYLRGKRLLLILDNCEHLIDAAAALATRIFVAAPQVHILATSREALRVEGEHVHRLAPLTFPPDDIELPVASALAFPATQLFVERATASGAQLELSDANAKLVTGMCRKLDGVPLAIELAAGRVEAFGLQQTAELLDQRLALLWLGQRSAPPRQQTLQATFDWSFELLSHLERVVLRRLAVFVGQFTMEAALAVVASRTIDEAAVFGAIDSLVAKSMLAARPIGAMMRYCLLETTRAYTLRCDVADLELDELPARHAAYYRRWLEQTGTEWPTLSNAAERAPHLAGLSNVRSALEWCFGGDGDARVGVELASAAAPVLLAMSLLAECHRWSERAIHALDDAIRGGREEMHLQMALGMSLMFTRGHSDTACAALNRSLSVAEELGDEANQLQLLGRLHMFHHRFGDFRTAFDYAMRSSTIANSTALPAAIALAHTQLGVSLSYMGDLSGAHAVLEASLQHGSGARRTGTIFYGFDHHNIASAYLARTLWLQGFPDQAVERARRSVDDAARMEHPVTLSIALQWAIFIFFWIGDLQCADEYTAWLISHADTHSLAPYLAAGRGFQADLAIRRGDANGGVESMHVCLAELHAARYGLLISAFNISLAQGLALLGRFAEANMLIDEAIRRVEVNGDLSYMPELLRVKGCLLLAMPKPATDDAERCFLQSLKLSRHRAMRAWELRTAVDLATMSAGQGRPEHGRALLQPVLQQFTEGWSTADLKAAGHILATLG